MTSPLPPKRRDTRDSADLIRQLKQNARQLGGGFVGGRFPPAKPLGATAQVGDLEDDGEDEILLWEWNDRHTITSLGTQQPRLTYTPVEESLTVFWHRRGRGGVPLASEMFTVDDKIVTIPNPGFFAVGDTFSFQYPHLDEEPDPIDPSLVGYTVPGAWDAVAETGSFAMPPGTVAGDLIFLTVRGSVAPGGGELLLDVSCSDSRMTLAHRATTLNSGATIAEAVYVGIADGSGSPVVVSIDNSGFPAAVGAGVLATFTGANGWGAVSVVESGTATPVAAGVAAVAAVWVRGASFITVNADPPTGYTDVHDTGSSYSSTDLSWWYDAEAATSPAGTFVGEGCCVVAII